MRRREFITMLGAVASPLAAHGQVSLPVIGWLSSGSKEGDADVLRAFRQGLRETGFENGNDAIIEYWWSDGQNHRLPAMATELVRRQVNVIAAAGTAATLAAKLATTTIPIVFLTATDPVREGFATVLNRPGGNLTGATSMSAELGAKRLELLHEALPAASVVAVLVNPDNLVLETQSRDLQGAARALRLRLQFVQAGAENEFDAAFAAVARLRQSALVIGTDLYFLARTKQLAELSLAHGISAIYSTREFALAGGLMAYGATLIEGNRLTGRYVGRILKGEKPADLPVVQSTKFELVINLKTAKALGLTVPPAMLAIADEVIE
jgi:putative ABC transport system substrate-binding protein